MGVLQQFGRDAKSWIDGVEVTEDNYESLVALNVRRRSAEKISQAMSEVDYLWGGKPNLPERSRVLEILGRALKDVLEA